MRDENDRAKDPPYRDNPESSILADVIKQTCHVGLLLLALIGGDVSVIPQRTLQHAMKKLVISGQVIRSGAGPTVQYRLAGQRTPSVDTIKLGATFVEIITLVSRHQASRTSVGYDHGFMNCYQPGQSWYLASQDCLKLSAL